MLGGVSAGIGWPCIRAAVLRLPQVDRGLAITLSVDTGSARRRHEVAARKHAARREREGPDADGSHQELLPLQGSYMSHLLSPVLSRQVPGMLQQDELVRPTWPLSAAPRPLFSAAAATQLLLAGRRGLNANTAPGWLPQRAAGASGQRTGAKAAHEAMDWRELARRLKDQLHVDCVGHGARVVGWDVDETHRAIESHRSVHLADDNDGKSERPTDGQLLVGAQAAIGRTLLALRLRPASNSCLQRLAIRNRSHGSKKR